MSSTPLHIAALTSALLWADGAGAQDFSETQRLNNRVLFSRADATAERHAAEARHVQELDARSQEQATLLQQQTLAVQKLGSTLETQRDERRLIDVADAFDAAVVAGQWPIVRSLMADEVSVDLGGRPFPAQVTVSADAFVAAASRQLTRAIVLPRSNQRVEVDGDRAILRADGFAWSSQGQPRGRSGRFEYRFLRTAQHWLVEAVVFLPAPDQ